MSSRNTLGQYWKRVLEWGRKAKEWWWVVSEDDTADYVEPMGGGVC